LRRKERFASRGSPRSFASQNRLAQDDNQTAQDEDSDGCLAAYEGESIECPPFAKRKGSATLLAQMGAPHGRRNAAYPARCEFSYILQAK